MSLKVKRVIDGKVYNTETAELIAQYDDGLPLSDFNSIYENLYRTKNGTWFLYGEGGPLTKYAISLGDNSTTGGDRLTPFSEEEALSWLEHHDETEVIEKYFSHMIEEA